MTSAQARGYIRVIKLQGRDVTLLVNLQLPTRYFGSHAAQLRTRPYIQESFGTTMTFHAVQEQRIVRGYFEAYFINHTERRFPWNDAAGGAYESNCSHPPVAQLLCHQALIQRHAEASNFESSP
jgi:hypothetical protein